MEKECPKKEGTPCMPDLDDECFDCVNTERKQ